MFRCLGLTYGAVWTGSATGYFGVGEVGGHPEEDGAAPQLVGESHLPQVLMIVSGHASHGSRRSSVLVTGGFNHLSVTGAASEAAAGQQQWDSSNKQEQDSRSSRSHGQ